MTKVFFLFQIEKHNKLMEAPLYRSFRAYMYNKIKLKVDVNIGISWQRIEIDPVPQKTPKFLPFKQKSVSYPMDSLVCCYITEKKSNKIHFRIVYCTESSSSSTSSSPSRNLSGIFSVGKYISVSKLVLNPQVVWISNLQTLYSLFQIFLAYFID